MEPTRPIPPLSGDYERDLNRFVSVHPDCTNERPWLLYVGKTCPQDQRPGIDRRVPLTGSWIFGIDDHDAIALAKLFIGDDAERALGELADDKVEGDALGLQTYRYLAFDHTGCRPIV